MPRTECVVFMDVDRPKDKSLMGEVPWGRVVDLLGGKLVHQEGMCPERYRVQGFPDEQEARRWG